VLVLLVAPASVAATSGRAAPMEIVSVTTTQPVTPALVGEPRNPVALVRIETAGSADPLTVQELRVHLRGTTDLADIALVEVLDEAGAALGPGQPPAEGLTFRGELGLVEGLNTLRVALTLAPSADLDHVVDAACESVGFSDGSRVRPEVASPPGAQLLGLALRNAGDAGAAAYRIPALATTREGTLVAAYDIRWKGWSDLPGDVDVGLSRSLDGGRSWEPMRVILDMGRDPAFHFDGVGDPALLVDAATGTIWVAALWSHGDRGWRGSGPGLSPDETGQLVLARSDDDGRTWSDPINITRQVKRPEWSLLFQGPGRGISMRDGTLVFAAQFLDSPEEGRTPHSTILYSRDHGETWELGSGAKPDTTEAQVEELDPGVLMLNMRDNRGGSRSVYTTRDLGRTWQEHPTSRRDLVEPVCNAALLRAGPSTLLFANPAVPDAPRRHMTLKASPDLGTTWPEASQLLLDAGESPGYASLSMIDAQTIGILFEGSRAQLTFMRIPLAELLH
jgi:sialidase-1